MKVLYFKSEDDGDGTYEEAWVEGTDYLLAPLNAVADNVPWDCVVPRSTSSWGASFPRDVLGGVRVEGLFGWSYVPPGIVLAVTMIANRLLARQRSAVLGVASFGESLAARIAREDPDVARELERFSPSIPKV